MNKIFVTGDVHGDVIKRLNYTVFPTGRTLDSGDFVFIAGDFGHIWENHENPVEEYALDWLSLKPYNTMIVGGNHENWDRLRAIPLVDKFGVKLGQLRENVFFVPNGTLITIGGKKIFCFGGAMSTDRGGLDHNIFYPGEGSYWWRGEIPTKQEMDSGVDVLEANGWEVDTIISHTMPSESVEVFNSVYGFHFDRVADPTARYLSFIRMNARYNNWYCGHFHKNESFDGVQCLYHQIVEIGTSQNMVDYGDFWNSLLEVDE
jgi:hypothetical protein